MGLCLTRTTFSQEKGVEESRNFITTTFSYYYLYDSTPITQLPHLDKRRSTSSSFGLRYIRRINQNHGWSASLCFYNFVSQTRPESVNQGDILSRYFFLFQSSYHRTILIRPNGTVDATVGLSYRIGQEIAHINYIEAQGGGFSEGIILFRGLFDIGLPIGIEATRLLGKHFHIKARFSHTFFPYLYYKKEPYYQWDKGSPRNMTSLTFGIGVNF